MMKSHLLMVAAFGVVATACTDIPDAPQLAGMSVTAAENQGQNGAEMLLTVAFSNGDGHAHIDPETARVYVKQTLLNGYSENRIVEFAGEGDCERAFPDTQPVAMALVLDRSQRFLSDYDTRQLAYGVVDATHEAPLDSIFAVVNSGVEPVLEQGFTHQITEVEAAIMKSTAPVDGAEEKGSALFQSIELALEALEDAPPGYRKGVVVIGAATETEAGASISPGALIDGAMAQSAPIFIAGMGELEWAVGSESGGGIDEIADATGGRYLSLGDPYYTKTAVGGFVKSLRNAFQICVPALVVNGGADFATPGDLMSIGVTIEMAGSQFKTVRPL